METTKSDLAGRLVAKALLRGTFTLRSGAVSNVYFDKYRFESDPALLDEITGKMAANIPSDVEVLAGLEMGGIPVATMLAQKTGLPCLFVRKKAKDYGTCKLAEGGEIAGKKLLVVEDVVTSGGQILLSVAELRALGAIVTDVVCVIDREAGGVENLQKEGLTLHSLFKMSELMNFA
ncbi:MAG TPA: orotate phosphoribosyltransferase [Kiritimatiellia bacterium]|nr:orotate phosphoribosyltransferase [Kiritimatiellia bacterium]